MNGWHDVLKEKMKRLEHLERSSSVFSGSLCFDREEI